MAIERRRLLYQGRVQGVGFRFTTERIARNFAVSGHVRNLDDGSVEVVVEGEPPMTSAFLDAIDRELGGHIRGVHEQSCPPGESPSAGFTIRY